MKLACLDTSTINNFLDDPESDALATTFLRDHEVYISSLNILEIAKTKDPNRREELRAFAKRLGQDIEPLELPNHLVRQVCRAYAARTDRFRWSVDNGRRQFWTAMSKPNSLGETERQEALGWARDLESANSESNVGLRDELEANVFGEGAAPRPRSPAQLMKIYLKGRWQLRYEIPAQVYKRETGRVLPLSQLDVLLGVKPSVWPLYLMAYAFSAYYGAIWQAGLGPKNRVGLIDLLYAVYLPACDLFITHDTANGGQYGALRVLNAFNSRRPRSHVLTWQQLRQKLAA